MTGNTTKLYGDGRHRALSVSWEGRQVIVRFEGADRLAVTDEYGSDLPQGLADKLLAIDGTWVMKAGDDPPEAKKAAVMEKEKARERQQAEGKETGRGSEEGGLSTRGTEITLPHKGMTVTELKKLGASVGISQRNLKKLKKKDDLLTAVDAAVREAYPGLEDAKKES